MLKFENPTNGRYYYLDVQRDLLDDCVLVIFRGGHHHNRIDRIFLPSGDALRTTINRLSKRRLARGYILKPNYKADEILTGHLQ